MECLEVISYSSKVEYNDFLKEEKHALPEELFKSKNPHKARLSCREIPIKVPRKLSERALQTSRPQISYSQTQSFSLRDNINLCKNSKLNESEVSTKIISQSQVPIENIERQKANIKERKTCWVENKNDIADSFLNISAIEEEKSTSKIIGLSKNWEDSIYSLSVQPDQDDAPRRKDRISSQTFYNKRDRLFSTQDYSPSRQMSSQADFAKQLTKENMRNSYKNENINNISPRRSAKRSSEFFGGIRRTSSFRRKSLLEATQEKKKTKKELWKMFWVGLLATIFVYINLYIYIAIASIC